MVTELMGGGHVEGVIEKVQDHRIPLGQAISIAQETCRGLEHRRGGSSMAAHKQQNGTPGN